MDLRLKINFFLSAVISLATIFLLFDDELSRRLGEYLTSYEVLWVAMVVVFLLLGFRFIGTFRVSKTVVIGLALGYVSTVLAYVLAVVLDVTGVRDVHETVTIEILAISLVFPFFALRGWLFCVLFIPITILLNYFSVLGRRTTNKRDW